MEFKNLSMEQFLNLETQEQEQYSFYIKYSIIMNTSKDHFKIGDMTGKPFGLIKDLQYDLSSCMSWIQIIEYVHRITGEGVKLDMVRFMQTWKYITTEIERITEIERLTLAYIPTDDEVRAGIEELNVLGSYLQFRQIAKSLNMTIENVENMRYDKAFIELIAQKKISEYEENYSKILRNKK